MMNPNAPNAPNDPNVQALSPDGLANQLFDAAFLQCNRDPREAGRQVIHFLAEALVYTVTAMASDEASRRELLKSLGDKIAAAPFLGKAAPKP